MSGPSLLVATLFSSGLLAGLLAGLLPQVRTPLSQCLGVSESALDRFHTAYLLLLIPLLILGGWATDSWGAAEIIFTGSLLSALGLATLGLRDNSRALATAVFLLAAATACLIPACVVLMVPAFWGEDEPVASINLGFVVIGFAYLVLPLLVGQLCKRFTVRQTLLVLALFSLVPGGLSAFVSLEASPRASGPVPLFADPVFWLVGLAAVCYFPLEQSLPHWTTPYLVERGNSDRQVRFWLCGFWVLFLAARFVTGQLLDPRFGGWWLVALVPISAVTLGNLAGAYGRTGGRGLVVVGACLGPVLPTLFGLLVANFHQTSATGVAATCALGLLSQVCLCPVITAFAKSHEVRQTIRVPLVLALVMAVPVIILALIL